MVTTRRIRLDRIASSTLNAHLDREVLVGSEIVCREGFVLAVRIRGYKSTYNQVEDLTGRMVPLRDGDVLAGVLGSRRALRGYAGVVPDALATGDTVHVLNLGGVLGHCTSMNPEFGPPFEAEVLGAVLSFPPGGDRVGRPAEIRTGSIPSADRLALRAPVVYVAGTCMDSGKTVACTEIVRGLGRSGMRVAAAKLTGVSLRRDTLAMCDAGAVLGLSFNDAGVVSTREDESARVAKGLFNRLDAADPEVVVAELGDGILGEYGVQTILADPELTGAAAAIVLCAPDPVAAWGAVRVLEETWALRPAVVAGPVTDNDVGCRYVRDKLHLPAHNARRDAEGLVGRVLERVHAGA